MKALADIPEFPLVVFGFAFHFIWEMLQVPLYLDMASMPHWDATRICALAAGGDILILLSAFYVTSLMAWHRQWIRHLPLRESVLFLAVGIVVTIIIEYLSTSHLDRWHYSDLMPVIPVIDVGLSPFIQWIIVPFLTLWFAKYYLRGRERR